MYVLTKMEGTGANKTKKGNCTNLHNERTAKWPNIYGQGRERVEESWGKG